MRGGAGLTLIELTVAVVVFAAIVAIAYPTLMTANDSLATGNTKDRMERKGDRLLNQVRDFLRAGRVVSVSAPPAPPEVEVVRPREGVALADLSADGEVPWKANREFLRFRPVRTVREADTGEDLNGDGDRADEFALGRLEIENARGARPITTAGLVVLALPDYRGDVDGDGAGDPLFDLADRNVDVDIHLLDRDAKGRPLRTRLRTSLRLKNVQR